jgi:hypothetical protein
VVDKDTGYAGDNDPLDAVEVGVGLGRIVVSEIEAVIILVNLAYIG